MNRGRWCVCVCGGVNDSANFLSRIWYWRGRFSLLVTMACMHVIPRTPIHIHCCTGWGCAIHSERVRGDHHHHRRQVEKQHAHTHRERNKERERGIGRGREIYTHRWRETHADTHVRAHAHELIHNTLLHRAAAHCTFKTCTRRPPPPSAGSGQITSTCSNTGLGPACTWSLSRVCVCARARACVRVCTRTPRDEYVVSVGSACVRVFAQSPCARACVCMCGGTVL